MRHCVIPSSDGVFVMKGDRDRLPDMVLRRQLEGVEARAGEAFRADWLASGGELKHRRADAVPGARTGDVMVVAARERVGRAKAALGWDQPSMEARAVNGVVLQDRSCGEVAALHGWGQPGVAMAALREGLRRLAGVYGLGEGRAA